MNHRGDAVRWRAFGTNLPSILDDMRRRAFEAAAEPAARRIATETLCDFESAKQLCLMVGEDGARAVIAACFAAGESPSVAVGYVRDLQRRGAIR
jgi:hypothetical protein